MSVAATENGRERLKAQRVYEALRQRITSLQLTPGILLRKDAIAREFAVSRAPVNDAIARLAEEGLVEVFPQHGSFVASLKPDDVRQGHLIRAALEVEIVRAATRACDAMLSSALLANLKDQERALHGNDLRTLYKLDEAMHELIGKAANMTMVERAIAAARTPSDRMRQLTLPLSGRAQSTVREHRWIVEAIISGDADLAAAAMRAHMAAVANAVELQITALSERGATG